MNLPLIYLATEEVFEMTAENVLAVVFTGLTVVFIGLALLIIFVSLLGSFFKKKTVKPSSNDNSIEQPKKKIVQQPQPKVEDGISDEVVAVITAAISAMNANTDGKIFAVKSIKQSRTLRPIWALAGIQENTRPF